MAKPNTGINAPRKDRRTREVLRDARDLGVPITPDGITLLREERRRADVDRHNARLALDELAATAGLSPAWWQRQQRRQVRRLALLFYESSARYQRLTDLLGGR